MKKTKKTAYEDDQVRLDVSVDENELDDEWVQQSRLYHRYAVLVADARRAMDESKNQLELEKADVDKSVRENPADYGLEKLTEAMIGQAVTRSHSVQNAQKALIDARHEYEVMQAAVAALDHKKSALENLVKLRLADYYSEPKAKDVSREAVDQMEKGAIRRKYKMRRADE